MGTIRPKHLQERISKHMCLFECLIYLTAKETQNVTFETIIYKYNILERVIVENITPRNVIINRGAAEVDTCNHISRDDFSTITLSRMLYLFY